MKKVHDQATLKFRLYLFAFFLIKIQLYSGLPTVSLMEHISVFNYVCVQIKVTELFKCDSLGLCELMHDF